jgi:dephospho-CoA kinase
VTPGPTLNVGLTGNVASGKSTVARVWAAAGVPVVSADDLARAVVAPGSDGLRAVADAFGPGVLSEDGTLDRGKMRRVIVSDPEARGRLEAILHPRIAAARLEWIEARSREGHPILVSEIPLLFEAGLEGTVDRIVLVHAPEPERLRRLRDDRGLSEAEARALMATQSDPDEKRARAHHVLLNDGDVHALEGAALELLELLRAEGRRAEGLRAEVEQASSPPDRRDP